MYLSLIAPRANSIPKTTRACKAGTNFGVIDVRQKSKTWAMGTGHFQDVCQFSLEREKNHLLKRKSSSEANFHVSGVQNLSYQHGIF